MWDCGVDLCGSLLDPATSVSELYLNSEGGRFPEWPSDFGFCHKDSAVLCAVGLRCTATFHDLLQLPFQRSFCHEPALRAQ
jgi:hypothetical protein